MTKQVSVPDELRPAFDRVMACAPEDCCSSPEFIKTVMMHLKIGGIKLAMQHLEVLTMDFPREFDLFKKKTDEANDANDDEQDEESEDDSLDDED